MRSILYSRRLHTKHTLLSYLVNEIQSDEDIIIEISFKDLSQSQRKLLSFQTYGYHSLSTIKELIKLPIHNLLGQFCFFFVTQVFAEYSKSHSSNFSSEKICLRQENGKSIWNFLHTSTTKKWEDEGRDKMGTRMVWLVRFQFTCFLFLTTTTPIAMNEFDGKKKVSMGGENLSAFHLWMDFTIFLSLERIKVTSKISIYGFYLSFFPLVFDSNR